MGSLFAATLGFAAGFAAVALFGPTARWIKCRSAAVVWPVPHDQSLPPYALFLHSAESVRSAKPR